jgi:hypothetical protein
MNDIALRLQVLVNEFPGQGLIGADASRTDRSQDNDLRRFLHKKAPNSQGINELDLFLGGRQNMPEPVGAEIRDQALFHHIPMTGYEDPGIRVHVFKCPDNPSGFEQLTGITSHYKNSRPR